MKTKSLLFMMAVGCVKVSAQIIPNHIFADSMVLQREKPVKIWGWASPEEKVQVAFGNQVKKTTTNGKGEWALYLDPLKTNNQPQDLIIKGKNKIIYSNILVGDVWVLGGQSNMEFDLDRVNNGDLEVASANFNNIHLMTIPFASGQKSKKDFDRINEYDSWLDRYDKKGYWFVCSPETVKTFSAMGYIFGRRIFMASQIPIGLIDVSVGGTTLEAWLSSGMLQALPENKKLIAEWDKKVNAYNPTDNLNMKIANWEKGLNLEKKRA